MKYSVIYGVNDSHMTECELFPLYRDALAFYNEIDTDKYPSAVCYKLSYNKDGFVCAKETKQYRLEKTHIDWDFFHDTVIEPVI